MTTTITSTIGTDGADYPSFNAWTASFPSDLVAADVAVVGLQTTTLVGSGTLLTLDGHNTDATHSVTIKPAPGKGRTGGIVNYDESAGVGIRSTASYVYGSGIVAWIGDSNVTLQGLQIYSPNGAPVIKWNPSRFPGPYNWLLLDCIFRSDGAPQVAIIRNAVSVNCLFLLNGGQGQEIVNVTGDSFFYNCDIVESNDVRGASASLGSDFSSIYVENSAMFGARGLTAGSSPSNWTWVNCMSDTVGADPGNPQVYTGIPAVVSYTGQFLNNSFASGDFRTTTSSSLIGAGMPDLAHAPADIFSTPRSVSWDIGCYETASGTAPPPPACLPIRLGGSSLLVAGLALGQAARRNNHIVRRSFFDPRRW